MRQIAPGRRIRYGWTVAAILERIFIFLENPGTLDSEIPLHLSGNPHIS
jgi:hypothetical protein